MKLFTQESCTACATAKHLLGHAGVEYVEVDLESAEGMAEYLMVTDNAEELPLLVLEDGEQFTGRAALDAISELFCSDSPCASAP